MIYNSINCITIFYRLYFINLFLCYKFLINSILPLNLKNNLIKQKIKNNANN